MDHAARTRLVRARRLEIKEAADMRDFIVSRQTVGQMERGLTRARTGAARLGNRIKRRIGREIDHQLAEHRRRDRAATRRINMREAARIREHGPDISENFQRRSRRVALAAQSMAMRAQAGTGAANRWRGSIAQVGQDTRALRPTRQPPVSEPALLDRDPTQPLPRRPRRNPPGQLLNGRAPRRRRAG